MQKIKLIWSAGLCLGVMLLCSACGGSDAPDLGNVTGTITLDGAPLADANVTFMPEKVRASSAKTDSAGKYELIYIRDEKGAALGDHKVVVSKLVNEKETIPPNYSDETELTAVVKSGDNEINFDLSSK
ncbi:carboxypeptidase-like regulatory domain-containing protein [Gimesia panareensis]|uniref:carboxypeptidase-like regulatory domain-containing protein n=1 Tax=Gimesia panareensis TaxID=2527978 RepID=UPI00118D56D8|nr:carboxypeptidase-like regulatory domain-containing protein [Gimesia panareensis]QDU50835.1 hypothetical protein Pan110_31950 [Gimesia panareensis]